MEGVGEWGSGRVGEKKDAGTPGREDVKSRGNPSVCVRVCPCVSVAPGRANVKREREEEKRTEH